MVEAASENPSLKFALFDQLDQVTAGVHDPGQQHQLDLDHRNRVRIPGVPTRSSGCISLNPVPVMQLVEVIRGQLTSDATTTQVMDLAKALGRHRSR